MSMAAPEWSWAGRVLPYTEPYRFREHLFTLQGSPPAVLSVAFDGTLPVLAPPEALLWMDRGVTNGVMAASSAQGPLLSLSGAGQAAFRSPELGRLVLLHLPPGAGLVVQWARLVCLSGVACVPDPSAAGLPRARCCAEDGPGLLAFGVARAVFELELGADESLVVADESLLWASEELLPRPWGPSGSLLHCAGPGLIALDMAGAPTPAKRRT